MIIKEKSFLNRNYLNIMILMISTIIIGLISAYSVTIINNFLNQGSFIDTATISFIRSAVVIGACLYLSPKMTLFILKKFFKED